MSAAAIPTRTGIARANSLPYSTPSLPLPWHLGHVSMPNLAALVTHAFGLARKGTFLGTFPVPLQTGHLASIAILSTHPPLFLLDYAHLV